MVNYKGLDCVMGEITHMACAAKDGIHEQHVYEYFAAMEKYVRTAVPQLISDYLTEFREKLIVEFETYFNGERMKKGENYTASPWKMVYVDENYYLLAFESGRFKHFRVDKMENVTELNMPREGGDASGNLDMSDYNKHIFGMYGSEVVPVTMVFLFKMMGAVMDKFGHDIMIMKEDEKHFRITVPVAVSQQFFGWVFGLGKMARIVAPESVKQKMRTMLTKIAQKYEDE